MLHDATLTQLECLSRVGESEWTCEVVLPSVSFASLVLPSDEELKQLPVVEFSERSLYLPCTCTPVLCNCRVGARLPKAPVPDGSTETHDKTVLFPRPFPSSSSAPQGLVMSFLCAPSKCMSIRNMWHIIRSGVLLLTPSH